MNTLKKILLFLAVTLAIFVGAFYLYLQTLPTAPPDFVDSDELNSLNNPTPFSCSNNTSFNYAYQVHVDIESVLNDQQIYHSELQFKTQLSQASDAIIQGIARDININEGQGPIDIKDVFYLSRVAPQPYAVFTAFNDLGLSEKHPMKILAQLFKALSIGEEGKKYHFAYDSMQRTYSYHHQQKEVSRNASVTTTNLNKLASSLQMSGGNNNWNVVLGDDCMPILLHSEERQGITAAGHNGYIKFTIDAKKISPFTDLSKLELNNLSNINNLWQVRAVANANFEKPVESEEELWSIIANFSNDKNSAKLIKAAEYLIENISPDSLSQKLITDDLSDSEKRDLAFALSLSGHDDAENYLIESLNQLTSNAINGDINTDLQKVRLMVALSGNGQVSEQGYQALTSLANNTDESSNVRNNALINLGSSLQQMENQGQSPAGLTEQLTTTLSQALSGEQASSAILAAGNANLTDLDDAIVAKLSSVNSKERYAAGTVLARNPEHTDTLLSHLQSEPSDLVRYAIISNLDKNELSSQQINRLEDIANTSSEDLARVIRQFIQ
ncbi:MAG: hypothetical protein V7765_16800 [Oleispira sp.]